MTSPAVRPNFAAAMMAAVPYRDMDRTARVILENFPEAPSLPVMTRSIRWLLEGIPCVVFDREKQMVYLDISPDREEELLTFYDRYEQDDLEYFATSRRTAPFFHHMIDRIKAAPPPEMKWLFFHSAGPVLLGDMLKQLDGRPAIHNETLRDVLIKGIAMKTRWLERKIKTELPGVEVVADLPETTLVNFTSSGGTGTRGAIRDAINQGFDGLNCTTMIHCCANIDWSLLTETEVRIINFDAYAHAENAALYSREFKAFVDRGGMIAWGIVPVQEDLLAQETVPSLIERLERGIELFVNKGIDEAQLALSSWIIPSCETVLLTEEQSDRVFVMTREISQIMREKYAPAH